MVYASAVCDLDRVQVLKTLVVGCILERPAGVIVGYEKSTFFYCSQVIVEPINIVFGFGDDIVFIIYTFSYPFLCLAGE